MFIGHNGLLLAVTTASSMTPWSASFTIPASKSAKSTADPGLFRPLMTTRTTPSSSKLRESRSGELFIEDLTDSDGGGGGGGGLMMSNACIITPEGYGFTSPAERILKVATRKEGYHRAVSSDRVVDVMDSITSDEGEHEVALVFGDDSAGENKGELIGLFTEADFIKFSTSRGSESTNEEESVNFLLTPIEKFVTPADELVAVAREETANVVIASMKQRNIRHVVVADIVSEDRTLLPDSQIQGVISMQDVMSIVQRDEKLSLASLSKKYPAIRSPVEQLTEQLKSTANEIADNPKTAKEDIIKVGAAALFAAAVTSFFFNSPWLHDHADLAMISIFVLGYLGIIFEEVFEFNKAGVALLMSTGLWVTYADFYNSNGIASGSVVSELGEQLAEVSDICFFLLAASAIVEVVDAHQGFKVVTNKIQTTSKKELFWTIGFLTFFLSAILNNLTVTIVMVSLLRKLLPNDTDRRLFGAMVVVAANAGGVWTPIGDVTTTMLWINNQLSTVPTILQLFLPSVVCLVGSLAYLVRQVEEYDDADSSAATLEPQSPLSQRGQLVFWSGIASLLSVPVFAELTGLPPYLAMLTGLGAMWTLTDIIHMGDADRDSLKVPAALAKLDTAGILFFLGILMSIGVLDKSGLLKDLAVFLSDNLPNLDIIATVIGLASALIDNVPLVAATMGMYDLSQYGTDDRLWQLIALCAGTGGSILVIGSASGVALMGLEKVDFLWYAKNVSIGAALGYFAGIAAYLVQTAVLTGSFALPQAAVAMDMVQQTVAGGGLPM